MKKAHHSEYFQQSWGYCHFLTYGASKLRDTLLMTRDVMVFRSKGVCQGAYGRIHGFLQLSHIFLNWILDNIRSPVKKEEEEQLRVLKRRKINCLTLWYISSFSAAAGHPFTLKMRPERLELIQHSGNVVYETLLGQSSINQMSYGNFMLG